MSHLITWDDFKKTEVRCSTRPVEWVWEEVTHCQVVCGLASELSSSLEVAPASLGIAPTSSGSVPEQDNPALLPSDCQQECWTDLVQRPVRWEEQCDNVRVLLPDGDLIDVTVVGANMSGVPNDLIEIKLESGTQVTWWKALNLHREGSDTEMWNQDGNKSATMSFRADDFRSAQRIEFKKAKFLGVHTGVYDLKQLDVIDPGSRVTFTWVRD